MSSPALSKFSWIRRRARRLQRFYGIRDIKLAVYDAHLDWITFNGGAA